MATVGLYKGNLPVTVCDEPDQYCLFHVGPIHESDAIPQTNKTVNYHGYSTDLFALL